MSRTRQFPHLATALQEVCASHPVELAYVFGSFARGTADEDSDLDIAILATQSLSKAERHAMRLRLMAAVEQKLKIPLEKIDVIMLQDVPALLQYNVVRTGTSIFHRDQLVQGSYERKVEREYEDEAPLLDREADLTLDRILAHRS